MKEDASHPDLEAALLQCAVPMMLLGSVGPDNMSKELVFQVADIPSDNAATSETVSNAVDWLKQRPELSNTQIMAFRMRRKR